MTMYQDNCGPTQTPDDFDIGALREKYRLEREERLRKEGSKQYIELEDDFAGYYEVDPYTPVTPLQPIIEDIDVAVLGGGFAGLLSAAYLKKAGVDDVRIIELGGDFGGVWYWNRYPGIQCDNESRPLHTATDSRHSVEEVRPRLRDLLAIRNQMPQ